MARAGSRRRDYGIPSPYVTEEYAGYLPQREERVAKVAVERLDADTLWRRFVSVRRPVLIDGLAQDESWAGGQRWTDLEHLRSVAGSTRVKIEPIDAEREHFGTNAKRKQVRLDEFLDTLKDPKQAGKWYMTTQYVEEEEDEEEAEESSEEEEEDESDDNNSTDEKRGRSTTNGKHENSSGEDDDEILAEYKYEDGLPHVDLDFSLPPPTDALANEFPLPGPDLMGNLVLQQCNLWLGNGASGKSSGLHHDFHDNLYMLLSGRKRFLIWPPLAHRWLEPVGKLDRVHGNGLIEYDIPQQRPLRPDGLTMLEAATWLLRARVRAMHEADERAAQVAGEANRIKAARKGKARQTAEQQLALERLREAEAQLLLLQLQDEEASDIDEEDEDDEDDEDDVHENGFPDWNEFDSDDILAGVSATEDYEEEEEEEEDESDEVDTDRGPPTKRARRERSPPLKIRKGGLPGGLRGRLDARAGEAEEDEWDSEGPHEHFGLVEEDEDGADDAIDMVAAIDQRIAMVAQLPSESEGDEDEGEEALLGLLGESDEASDDDEDEDDDEEEDEGRGDGMGFAPADAEDDESESEWSTAEDGEAALEALARLQDEGVDIDPDEEDPMSFSRITPKALHWYFQVPDDPAASEEEQQRAKRAFQVEHGGKPARQRPLFPRSGCPPPIEVHLQPGQMLYLPASWYHEVTSYSEPYEKEDAIKTSASSPPVHMALNYWFHPPSALLGRGEGGSSKAGSKASGKSAAEQKGPVLGTAASPYLDPEVWDEVRKTVQEKIDEIRSRNSNSKSNGKSRSATASPAAEVAKGKTKGREKRKA